jgi:hypothetical protein
MRRRLPVRGSASRHEAGATFFVPRRTHVNVEAVLICGSRALTTINSASLTQSKFYRVPNTYEAELLELSHIEDVKALSHRGSAAWSIGASFDIMTPLPGHPSGRFVSSSPTTVLASTPAFRRPGWVDLPNLEMRNDIFSPERVARLAIQ